jgi:hypothetical protein
MAVVTVAALRLPRLSFAVAALLDGCLAVMLVRARGAAPLRRSRGEHALVSPAPIRSRGTRCREWVLRERARDPGVVWPYPRIMCAVDPRHLHKGTVFVTVHMGEINGLGAFLGRLSGEVLILQLAGAETNKGALTWIPSHGADEWEQVRVTKRLIENLQSGGSVLIAVDGPGRNRIETEVLGHTVSITSGAFAVSRLARVPVRPITARWHRSKLEFIVGNTIAPDTPAAMAGALGHWLSDYLSENAGELRWPLLRPRPAAPSSTHPLEQASQLGVTDLSVLGARDRPPGQDHHPGGREADRGDDRPGDADLYLLG